MAGTSSGLFWRNALNRALRTFLQAFCGSVVFMLGTTTFNPDTLPSISFLGRILAAAALAGIVAVCSAVQNIVEDNVVNRKLQLVPGANRTPRT